MKLLAIDDNKDNLTTLTAVMRDALPECEVFAALNGPEGIALARTEDPDVVLLDIVMPEMDGFEVCRRMKADVELRSIPIIFLTALRTDRESRIKAVNAGGDAFLTKPLDEQSLTTQVRAMVKVRMANRLQQLDSKQLAALVAERTQSLERELGARKRAEDTLVSGVRRNRAQQDAMASICILPSLGDGDVAAFAIQLTEAAAKAVGVDRVSVWLLNDDESELRCLTLYEAPLRHHSSGMVLRRHEFANEFDALLSARYVDAHDALTDARTAGYAAGYLKPLCITSMLDTVIRVRGRNLGVLCFEHVDQPHHWEPDEIAFACQLSDQIAIAVSNSERRLVEAALVETEKKYRGLFEESVAAVYVFDSQKHFVDANQAGLDLLGYSRDELLRLRIPDVDADPVVVLPAHQEFLSGGRLMNYEHKLRRKDGAIVTVLNNSRSLTDAKGTVVGLLSTLIDVTERKRAEAAAAREQALSKTIIDSIPGAFYMLDEKGAYVRWNAYQRDEIVGKPDDQVAGTSALVTIHPDDREFIQMKIASVLGGARVETAEARVLLRGGPDFRWLQMTGWPITIEGSPFLVGIGIDTTERKQAEVENAQLQSQLVQAQKMESVGRLAGGVAHDSNNLLMGIMNYADLCLDVLEEGHPIRGYLDEINNNAERSANLARQLLAFARKQAIAPKVLDLNDTVVGMFKMLEQLLGENISMTWAPGAGLWQVKVDPSQLDQILANLCVNARDAIAGVGRLTIETSNVAADERYCAGHAGAAPGEYVQLAVSDTGHGMGKDVLEHIFEPFFTTKEVGKGTGLGLATVYGIVDQNKGFITVYSEPGKGTTFKIHLPRCAAQETVAPVAAAPSVLPRGSETILLVEDEKSVRVTTHMFLEELGYKVLVADDPGKALGLAAQHSGDIDLLITDVIMPNMSGRHLADQLCLNRPSTRRLFMSGFTADVIAREGVLEDGVQFLTKPFGREALARKVREVLETGEVQSPRLKTSTSGESS
jgi:PAS domain S-box-containing protein